MQAHASRLVATCWAPEPTELLDRVHRAFVSLDAALPPDIPAGSLAGQSPGHLVEARLDLLSRPPEREDLSRLARSAPGRLLVTCRPDGPGAPPGRAARHAMLRSALECGAVAVDIEADGGAVPEFPAKILVLSHHESLDAPAPTSRRLSELTEQLAATAAAVSATTGGRSRGQAIILKLAVPTAMAGAALDLARAGHGLPAALDWAPVGLGPGGRWLRVMARMSSGPSASRPWSALAYCAQGSALPGSDVGQLRLDDALDTFRVDRLGPATRAFGIVGWPLEATWSPALHSALFAKRGLDAVLVPLPTRDVAEIARVSSALALDGLAVTMPHKESARSLADLESERVRRGGVLNTLRRSGGAWEAESFDGPAVTALLARHASLLGARVIVLGAGGAARAAGAELAAAGARVTFVARRREQADAAAEFVRTGATADGLRASAANLDALALIERDVLVNATPMGSASSPEWSVPFDALDSPVVLDMVSVPACTELVRRVRAAGRVGIDGLAMLAHQAAAQQRWWCEATASLRADEVERVLREIVARHD